MNVFAEGEHRKRERTFAKVLSLFFVFSLL